MAVQFNDFRVEVKAALQDNTEVFLEEATSEIESAASRNSHVDTGELRGSWSHVVDTAKNEATVGSSSEHAIYNEFGTGEYAAEGNGRKGGWSYKDDRGKWRFTYGIPPRRMLHTAFTTLKGAIINRAKSIFGGM